MAEQAESLPTSFCHNLSAVRAPISTDDVTKGFRKGSIWVYGSAGTVYMCTDSTINAAVWKSMTAGQAVWWLPL